MSRRPPGPGDLVICETVAAISTHYRIVSAEHPFKPGGHARPQPRTFCEREAAWDTELPPRRLDGTLTAGCRACLAVATSRRERGELPGEPKPTSPPTGTETDPDRAALLKAIETVAARFSIPVFGFYDMAPALGRVLFRVEELQRAYSAAVDECERWKRRAKRLKQPHAAHIAGPRSKTKERKKRKKREPRAQERVR